MSLNQNSWIHLHVCFWAWKWQKKCSPISFWVSSSILSLIFPLDSTKALFMVLHPTLGISQYISFLSVSTNNLVIQCPNNMSLGGLKVLHLECRVSSLASWLLEKCHFAGTWGVLLLLLGLVLELWTSADTCCWVVLLLGAFFGWTGLTKTWGTLCLGLALLFYPSAETWRVMLLMEDFPGWFGLRTVAAAASSVDNGGNVDSLCCCCCCCCCWFGLCALAAVASNLDNGGNAGCLCCCCCCGSSCCCCPWESRATLKAARNSGQRGQLFEHPRSLSELEVQDTVFFGNTRK